jgi:hypothetical protein
MTVSDTVLRRLAWGVWWLLPAIFVVGIPLTVVEERANRDTWGSGGLVGEISFGVIVLAFPLVGLLILRQQPRNKVGWLLQAIGLVWALGGIADTYATYGLLVNPGSVPRADVVAALNEGFWAPAVGLMGTFLILLYPDGQLPSQRWRPVAWLSGVTIIVVTVTIDLLPGEMEESPVPTLQNPLAWETAQPVLAALLNIFLPLLPLCIVACAAGLVARFSRSQGVERLQLKWLTAAGAVVALVYLLTMTVVALRDLTTLVDPKAPWVSFVEQFALLVFVLLPVSIGTAVLRHRLYEIDVVINRALVYGILTATLAAVYGVCVLLSQSALEPVTRQSELAVAISTLAVAAAFRPARARIQGIVDRRFYRSRYDAARTLEEFAERLRHQLDLEAVGHDLRAVVDESVQPAHVSLWLRP